MYYVVDTKYFLRICGKSADTYAEWLQDSV